MTNKPQAPEVAEVEVQDLPDTTAEAIADEVAKQVKAERDAERADVRRDLEEAFWLAGIEAFSAIVQALAPKAEITVAAAPVKEAAPKAPTEAEQRAQRIKAERAKLLTKREGA